MAGGCADRGEFAARRLYATAQSVKRRGTPDRTGTPRFDADAKVLERVVAAAFNQRRKMLRASLKGIASDIEDRLIAAGIKPTDRAEQIPLEGFAHWPARLPKNKAASCGPFLFCSFARGDG